MDVADVNGYPVEDDVRAAAGDTASLLASLGHHVEESYPGGHDRSGLSVALARVAQP
jgi:hypothetical protein